MTDDDINYIESEINRLKYAAVGFEITADDMLGVISRLREATQQCAVMADVLRNIRGSLAAAETEKYDECKWEVFTRALNAESIDAALAGKASVREVPQSTVGHVQHSKQVITDAVRNVIKAAAPKPEGGDV